MTLANVVKTTVFLADINDFAEMNKVYGEYFAQPYPARSAVQVASCPRSSAGDRVHCCKVSSPHGKKRNGEPNG